MSLVGHYFGPSTTGDAYSTSDVPIQAGDVILVIDMGTYDNTGQHGYALEGLSVLSWSEIVSVRSQFSSAWVGFATADLAANQTLILRAPTLVSGYGYRSMWVYVLRGISISGAGVFTSGSSTTVTTPDMQVGPGQFVLAYGIAALQADDLKNLVPALGWSTILQTNVYASTIYAGRSYREPVALETVRASASRASGLVTVHMLAIGNIFIPFRGWGIAL